MGEFLTVPVTEIERQHMLQDLRFIELISAAGKLQNIRTVVGGGYAVDGALGKLTRFHNDIDLQLYGQNSNAIAVVSGLLESLRQEQLFSDLHFQEKERAEFWHSFQVQKPGFFAELYYIQVVTNPSDTAKIVVKRDGSFTEKHAYKTLRGVLEGVSIEIQHPEVELADKLRKRKNGLPAFSRHNQDIKNLENLLRKID